MGSPKDHNKQTHLLTKKLITRSIYALLPLALLHFYLFPLHPLNQPLSTAPPTTTTTTTTTTNPSSSQGLRKSKEIQCNYSDGKWVPDPAGPRYNGTSCATIKDGQNCMAHGRPDTGYLHWRWQPHGCKLPGFDPPAFLRLIENKHLAFIGDSMARNQLESLLCLLSTSTPPSLVYSSGEENKFRRWLFPPYNATVSVYWSPFLVKGKEKSEASGLDHNILYLDSADEKWAAEMAAMDVMVFSIGHWFLHPAVYYDEGAVLGCHYCPGLNHTEIGFFQVFRKAFKTTLNNVIDGDQEDKLVIVTTFSPSHFEGKWDEAGACPRKEPYKEGEKEVQGMDEDMRRVQREEVELGQKRLASGKRRKKGRLRIEALDVTKLATLRPDGHPGPYMYPFPFADGVPARVQNDCVHWCLPGPIDTWNEILLEFLKRWRG